MASPTLNQLISANQSLLATWTNQPYIGINNAGFLVVDLSPGGEMRYVYLTESQALEQTGIIPLLVNGREYSVSYFQVMTQPDSLEYLSNVLTAIPSNVPEPAVINNIVYITGGLTATATVTIGPDNGAPIERVIFNMCQTTNANGTTLTPPIMTIETRNFMQNNGTGVVYDYTLVSLVNGASYIITVQTVNSAGYSNISPVYRFFNSPAVPASPSLNSVGSGFDSSVNLSFSATQPSSGNQLLNATFYCRQAYPSVGAWSTLGIYNFVNYVSGTNITINSLALASSVTLTNAIAVDIRFTVSSTAVSSYSNIKSGVPALMPTISAPSLAFTRDGSYIPTSINGSWSSTTGTFDSSVVSSVFTYFTTTQPTTNTTNTAYLSSPSIIPVTNLVPGSTCSDVMTVSTSIPTYLLPFWEGLTVSQNTVIGNTITATIVVTTLPGPVTNITHISGVIDAKGVIQLYWLQSANTGYTPIIQYSVTYWASYPTDTGVVGTTSGPIEQYSINNLDPTKQYWTAVTPYNSVGPGPMTYYYSMPNTIPSTPSQNGITISQTTVPTPSVLASQPSSATEILVSFTASSLIAANITGYYSKFDMYYFTPTGDMEVFKTIIPTNQPDSYVYSGTTFTAITGITEYTFGVKSYVSTAVDIEESLIGTTDYLLVGPPKISDVIVSQSTANSGILTFTLDRNNSQIISSNGIIAVVIPSEPTDTTPLITLFSPSIDTINNSLVPSIVTFQIPFAVFAESQLNSFAIFVTNAVAGAYYDHLLSN